MSLGYIGIVSKQEADGLSLSRSYGRQSQFTNCSWGVLKVKTPLLISCFMSFSGKIIQASPCSIRADPDVTCLNMLLAGGKNQCRFLIFPVIK